MTSISDEIFFAGIAEINQKLVKKEFSAVELARAFCDRLETIGPAYNGLALSLRKEMLRDAKDVDGDIKRERLRGPLQGVPFGAKDLLAARGANRVLTCVLLEKPGKRAVSLNPDFVGFTCPDLFVVGYGMDVAHAFRQLPYVGVIEKST